METLTRAWRALHHAIARVPARVLLAAALLAGAAPPAAAQEPAPYAHDIPPWFADTFLDFREDVRDAAKAGKRVMIYFGQDGCPYCRELLQTNFSQKAIVDKTRRHFVAIALNLWGDRDVTWIDGRAMSEKELARALKVQFTPTLLFLDEQGRVVARLNGYYPPHRFAAVLDYVSTKGEKRQPFADYMKTAVKDDAGASPTLHDEAFFLKPPYDLRRTKGAKALAVLFETRHCRACDELHREGLRRPEVQSQLGRFDVVRLALSEHTPVVTPEGRHMAASQWARELGVSYTPTIVFFDADGGKEVFRLEAYLRPFHLASSFEYVASGAWRQEPNFQRFLRARAERLRGRGHRVDLWE